MRVTLKTDTRRTNFISIYAPDINKSKEEKEIFFEQLQETMDKLSNSENIFIIGDFNSRIGNTPIPSVMQRFNEATTSDNGDMFIAFCS